MTQDEIWLKQVRDAKARIQKGWVQGVSAVDRLGNHVYPDNRQACRWCLTGAIFFPMGHASEAPPFFRFLRDLLPGEKPRATVSLSYTMDLVVWNDQPGRTQEEVLSLLQRAEDILVARVQGGPND